MPKGQHIQKSVKIDWDAAAKMYEADCTTVEVAACIGLSEDSLYKRAPKELGMTLSQFSAENRAKGHKSLRLSMHENAVRNDNVTMQMFLAKNRLGYADKVETKQEITMANEIELRIEAPTD